MGELKGCFFALEGPTRSGKTFLSDAYDKKIRVFVANELPENPEEDSLYIEVKDPLKALQRLALHHRSSFQLPIVAIMGRIGKTTTKEWIYELIKPNLTVVRSPKSYNSTIGVPLSLLELHEEAHVALIEVGGNDDTEREALLRLIQPTHLLVTQWVTEGFPPLISTQRSSSLLDYLKEIPTVYSAESNLLEGITPLVFDQENALPELNELPLTDMVSKKAACLAIGFAKQWGIKGLDLGRRVSQLKPLAMRLETFLGKNNTVVINDTYNLDMDALRESLEYLHSFGRQRPLGVIIGLDEGALPMKALLEQKIAPFRLDFTFIGLKESLPNELPINSVVLLKGTRRAAMEHYAGALRSHKHQTKLEINVSALKHNISQYKALLSPKTALLVMVKAQSYGSGLDQLFPFFEQQGIAYLGVAYTEEGIALRKKGITLPILVLNPDQDSYASCLEFQLEPCIGTFHQLDTLIRVVIESPKQRIPIHIEIETGMNRLGFSLNELNDVLTACNAQPEVYIQGVFSHFSDADNLEDRSFSERQINAFQKAKQMVEANVSNPVLFHMANSEAMVHYKEAHFNMVRLGLGMFGLSRGEFAKRLQFVLAWKSSISQVKSVRKGDRISYGPGFVASKEMHIAVIPVGYADGFRRALSDGHGWVWIQGQKCFTVGKVCMDMLMVDVSHVSQVSEGDEVVLFDTAATLQDLSDQLGTIPYELMTGISSRVQRVFLSDGSLT
jgi:alanine racemase